MQFTMKSEDINILLTIVQSFKFSSEMHRCILNMGVLKLLESFTYTKMFLYLDVNCDGLISVEDFKNEGKEKPDSDFKEFGVTQLTFTEFMISYCNWEIFLSRDYLRAFFEMIDNDKDGFVTVDDLMEYSQSMSLLDNEFKAIDSDKDGMISYEEFQSVISLYQD